MICELQLLNIPWMVAGLLFMPRLTLGCVFWVLGYPMIAAAVWAYMVILQCSSSNSATSVVGRI